MTRRVIVVGAGLAGVGAAAELAAAGVPVSVLEKSRGVGGRAATRRVEGELFDHGATCFRVRHPGFRRALAPLLATGEVSAWVDRTHRWDGVRLGADPLTHVDRRFALPMGATGLAKRLGAGLDVRLDARVTALRETASGWALETDGGTQHEAAAVVLAMPAPQAQALLETAGEAIEASLLDELARVTFEPGFSVLAAFDGPPPPWRAIESTAEPLAWISRESDKRPAGRTTVVAQSTGAFARAHWDDPDETVTRVLLAEAARMGGASLATPVWAQLKRWRYARPTVLATAHVLRGGRRVPVLCAGDWCVAPGVEGAWVSGVAAARRILEEGLA